MLTRTFGAQDRWGIALGVVATGIRQDHALSFEGLERGGDSWPYTPEALQRDEVQALAMLGLRTRL